MYKKRTYRRFFLVLLVLVFIIAVYFFVFPRSKGVVLTVFHPLFKGMEIIHEGAISIADVLKSNYELTKENKNLKKEIERLKGEIALLKQYEIENKELAKIANFKKKVKGFNLVTGKVIGFSPDNWSNFLIIDLGKKSGIKKGNLVISDGYLLGIVSHVGMFSSSILLVSDKNFKIPARTRKTREFVFFQGKDLKTGILKYVKPEQDIRMGDIIETTNIDKEYPSGIPIGKVKSIDYEEGDFFKNVDISLDINPFAVEYVVVITNKKKAKKK
ncbi:rod shape-determining protein MreC [Persephonella sp.]